MERVFPQKKTQPNIALEIIEKTTHACPQNPKLPFVGTPLKASSPKGLRPILELRSTTIWLLE
jgi:hypothetical protein